MFVTDVGINFDLTFGYWNEDATFAQEKYSEFRTFFPFFFHVFFKRILGFFGHIVSRVESYVYSKLFIYKSNITCIFRGLSYVIKRFGKCPFLDIWNQSRCSSFTILLEYQWCGYCKRLCELGGRISACQPELLRVLQIRKMGV